MAALAWLLIPLVGVLVAVVWARWAARTRSTADGASLAGYERFRTAMQPGEAPPLRLRKGEPGESDATDAEPV
ncbi:hypothetical protein [Actinacidiphila paucisporea]|uniref:Uncharacterized protein n=1 Tax=Actinacidiphila paucisporea TaxID=310782 RepID=A0A1M6UZA9_9ACTN|nr:hypothetical protein [Actinacidiphila paucisporea]SHK74520.1 hypothetical protein SAMN05216499_101532 [Actinacidiphila paucisporea]